MIPRLVVGGTSSGAGKTTVATGLLAALRGRGVRATGFKVGPDFIDPGYHALASGRPGRNLDAFMSGPELIAPLFRHGSQDAEVAIVEGVMGLYDGATGRGELASTAHVAKLLRAPVVLVLDAAALARSAAAIVHGYATFDPEVDVAGVVLNRVGSPWHASLLREALEPLGVPVLGALPRDARVEAPERHLGLVPVAERERQAAEAVDSLARAVSEHCDLPALLALAQAAPELPGERWSPAPPADLPPAAAGRPRIAVARGPAFSFHYEENLELLAANGAELAPFDPLVDAELPPRAGALLLAGGFPEAYGPGLSANAALRAEIAAFARRGRPLLAECGGLLYLATDLDGDPMCGVVAARARMTGRLTLGYREATAGDGHPVWPGGAEVRGHELHYAELDPPADPQAPAWHLRARGAERAEGHVAGLVHASFLHTHWAAVPAVAARLVAAAATAPVPASAEARA